MKKRSFKAMATGLVFLTATSMSYAAGRGGGGFNSADDFTLPSQGTGIYSSEEGIMPLNGGGRGMHMSVRNDGGIGSLIVSEGTEFTLTGVVQEEEMSMRGVTLITDAGEEIFIHGIGPAQYWENLGYTAPQTEDRITVFGYSVELNKYQVYIAFSVGITDEEGNTVTIPLRDEEGNPLAGPMGDREPLDILSGVPFGDYTGMVTEASQGLRFPTVMEISGVGTFAVAMGPIFYWESLGLSKPAVGDTITVTGYTVTTDQAEIPTLNIAATVVLDDGTEVQLLNDDGTPMWIGGKGQGRPF